MKYYFERFEDLT